MSRTQNTVKDEMHQRTHVSKRATSAFLTEKPMLVAIAVVCLLVGLVSFMPKHHQNKDDKPEEKQDVHAALSQNMAVIRDLKDAASRQRLAMLTSKTHDKPENDSDGKVG